MRLPARPRSSRQPTCPYRPTSRTASARVRTGSAETIPPGASAGEAFAGGSIEDYSGREDEPIYPIEVAAERVAAAAEAAHGGAGPLVLTARAENHLHGVTDLSDTIARLQAYQEAGADVLYAPGITRLEDIALLVASVDLPVNVLARPGVPSVDELAQAGVRRVSVGGAFAFAALGAVTEAARELIEEGTLRLPGASPASARRPPRPSRHGRTSRRRRSGPTSRPLAVDLLASLQHRDELP